MRRSTVSHGSVEDFCAVVLNAFAGSSSHCRDNINTTRGGQNLSASNVKTAASIVRFEIPADDLNRAKGFYSKLFGWKIAPFSGMPAPEAQNYLYIDTGSEDAPPDGGLMKRMHPQQPVTNYVSVPSVTEFSAKVERFSGKIGRTKEAVPGTGYFAICEDTEGNPFALWGLGKRQNNCPDCCSSFVVVLNDNKSSDNKGKERYGHKK